MYCVHDVLQNIVLLLRWDMDKIMDSFYGMVRFKVLRGQKRVGIVIINVVIVFYLNKYTICAI